MPESDDNLHLEIAHVLFMDIVGYSKLLVDEQAELVKELGDVVNNTEAARQAEARGQLIRLPAGMAWRSFHQLSGSAGEMCAGDECSLEDQAEPAAADGSPQRPRAAGGRCERAHERRRCRD